LNPFNDTTKKKSIFIKNIKLTSPGIGFLLSDFNNVRMELFNKGVHELTLCGLDQLSNKINIWLKDNSERIYTTFSFCNLVN
jgi:hypothetical protein